MRAEAQDHIDTINAALALVRRFLDWDRALRRLDELNAKVEDPTLWDNPKAAQEVMRERRRLDEAVTATRAIEKERDDTAELIELAEMEGDEAQIGRAHVCTPVTNAHLVCRLLLEKKKGKVEYRQHQTN